MTAMSQWHRDIEARIAVLEKAQKAMAKRLLDLRNRHEDLFSKTSQFANDMTAAFNGLVEILEPVGADLKVELEP